MLCHAMRPPHRVTTVTLDVCSLCFCTRVMSCVPTFFQNGHDSFLLACLMGHQEIVCELLTKDKVDWNVVNEVRN